MKRIFLLLFLLALSILFFLYMHNRAQTENNSLLDNLTQAQAQQDILGKTDFRDLVAEKLKAQHPELCVTTSTDQLLYIGLSEDSCNDVEVFTGNKYWNYVNNPKDLNFYIDSLLATIPDAIKSLETKEVNISKDQLIVVLRHHAYSEYLGTKQDKNWSIWEPFFGDVIAVLAYFTPDYVGSLTNEDLKSMGITVDEGWKIAAENLENKYQTLHVENNNGAQYITATTGVATGHLWLKNYNKNCDNFNSMVINKEGFVLAKMDNQEASNILAGYAANLIKENNTLSNNLISCMDGYWYASYFSDGTWRPIGE